jgi:hypothetical protein
MALRLPPQMRACVQTFKRSALPRTQVLGGVAQVVNLAHRHRGQLALGEGGREVAGAALAVGLRGEVHDPLGLVLALLEGGQVGRGGVEVVERFGACTGRRRGERAAQILVAGEH